jgi:hypothetical protein
VVKINKSLLQATAQIRKSIHHSTKKTWITAVFPDTTTDLKRTGQVLITYSSKPKALGYCRRLFLDLLHPALLPLQVEPELFYHPALELFRAPAQMDLELGYYRYPTQGLTWVSV